MKKSIVLLICTIIVFITLAAVFVFFRPERFTGDEQPDASISSAPTQKAETAAEASPVSEPVMVLQSPSSAEAPSPVESAEEEQTVSDNSGFTKLVFTGDVEISTSVQAKYDAGGVNGVVSDRLLSILHDADITMINHEFCFSLRGEKNPEKQFTFRVDPSYVSLLTDMGIDIAGLANNHVLDYGKTALQDTFTTLEEADIDYTGAGNSLEEASKLVIKSCPDGRKIGFLASSHVIPSVDWNVMNSQPGEFCFYDEAELLQAIGNAKQEVDFLFVMVHWGIERTLELTDYQINDAHRFIDAGADAVIGMHSHCLQPVEIYQGKPVFYSLGNFIFNKSIGSGGGGCVEVTISGNSAPRYRIIPTSAANAMTDIDEAGFDYVERISHGILVDPEGYIEAGE
ncbi:MAG: CapA family protein [Lachnospiraceae bacterium]|nr:CapA family protein [Lachnospiraceae bacterium]